MHFKFFGCVSLTRSGGLFSLLRSFHYYRGEMWIEASEISTTLIAIVFLENVKNNATYHTALVHFRSATNIEMTYK